MFDGKGSSSFVEGLCESTAVVPAIHSARCESAR
jgi:hypothetical protein